MPQEPIWALYNTNRVWRPSPATMVGPIFSYAVYPQVDQGKVRRST